MLCDVLSDDVSEVAGIAGIADERFHEHRDPGLVLDKQVQHDLLEVGTMILAVAPGDVNDLCHRFLGTVVTAIDVESRTVQMRKPRGKPKHWALVRAISVWSFVTS
jgi:hypothetical protein